VTDKKPFWGSLVIVAMWVTVLLIGVIDESEFVIQTATESVRIPVVLGIAPFAFVATWVVAWFAFRGNREPAPPAPGPAPADVAGDEAPPVPE
jgi:hypothetical protein